MSVTKHNDTIMDKMQQLAAQLHGIDRADLNECFRDMRHQNETMKRTEVILDTTIKAAGFTETSKGVYQL